MATQVPQPVTYVYKEVNKGKFKCVRHYEPIENINNPLGLTKINISKDQSFAKSSPQYWLKIRTGEKWSECLTGLFETCFKDVFWGDINNKQHLVIFKFSNDYDLLTIYFFKNYFTKELDSVLSFMSQHEKKN